MDRVVETVAAIFFSIDQLKQRKTGKRVYRTRIHRLKLNAMAFDEKYCANESLMRTVLFSNAQ